MMVRGQAGLFLAPENKLAKLPMDKRFSKSIDALVAASISCVLATLLLFNHWLFGHREIVAKELPCDG